MENKPKLWFWGKSGFKSKRNACSRGFQFFWRLEGEGGGVCGVRVVRVSV